VKTGALIAVFLLRPPSICAVDDRTQPSNHPLIFRVDTASSAPASIIKKILSRSDATASVISSTLDSLGYFNPSIDTLADTIVIRPGFRSVVARIFIRSTLPCSIDSIQRATFPRAYDAGELRALANKTLYFFGRRGFPFAGLSVDITDSSAIMRARPELPRAELAVIFTVSENGFYAFGRPRLLGKTKTNPRLLLRDISAKQGAVFDIKKIEESTIRLRSRPYISSVETGQLQIERERAADAVTDTPLAREFSGRVRAPFFVTDNTGLGVDGAVAFQAGQPAAGALTGIFNISLLNLFHYGETGLLSYRGERDYQRLEVSCSVPYLLGVALFGTGGFGLEIRQNEYGYLHGELQLTTDIAPFWQWGLALSAHEATRYVDSVAVGSRFEGLDFVMSRDGRAYRAGEVSKEVHFKLGSGLTQASGIQLTRWHIDLAAGEQAPLGIRHAVAGRMFFGLLLTDARDTLQTVELYRTGGYKSVRGYLDNEFAFTTVLYGQVEYHYYFNYSGSIYFFTDCGAGRLNKSGVPQTSGAVQKMLGYGLGIQIPVKIGDAAIEWARNYKETRSWGRIHISIRNAVAAGLPH